MFYACKGNDACYIRYDSYKVPKLQKLIQLFKYKASLTKENKLQLKV